MMSLRYLPLALIAVVLKAVQFFLGWLLIAPFVKADGNLPRFLWLRLLFQPDDSLAIGDFDKTPIRYQDREGAFTKNYPRWLRNYVLAVMWGARNPAYGWDSNVCGMRVFAPYNFAITGNPNVDIGYDGNGTCVAVLGRCFRTCTDDGRDYFELKFAYRWPLTNYACMCSFGWDLSGVFKFGKVRNLRIDIRPRVSLI